jgi:hypothetical protein
VRHFKQACVVLTAAIAITFGSPSSGAAEPISIEGGQIADSAPDPSGIRVFKGIPYAAPPLYASRLSPSTSIDSHTVYAVIFPSSEAFIPT